MQEGNPSMAHQEELEKLPLSFQEEFQKTEETLGFIFKEDEMASWAREALAISTRTPRSWEAGIEYLKACGEVAKYLSFASFTQWTRCGAYLSQDSPTLAVSYFRASPAIVADLRPQHIARWAGLGRSLYKGTWKSSTLAATFFETSPTLVKNLSFWDVEVCANLIETLSSKSYDVATECLVMGSEALPRMSREREPFLALCRTLTDSGWREVKACFQVVGRALPQIEESQRSRFLRLADHLAREGTRDIASFLVGGSAALGKIRPQAQQHVLDLCDTLMVVSPAAVHALLNSLESVLSRITLPQLDAWFDRGLRLMHENPEGGLAYFKVESSTSEAVIDSLSSSLELERVKGILMLYCRALSGFDIEVTESDQLVGKGIGWVSEGHATTEGTKVFLPLIIDRYPSKDENFGWFKVVSTHQVAHLEFGSFLFEFERPSALFEDTRMAREEALISQVKVDEEMAAYARGAETGWVTDITRCFSLLSDRKLALDLFTILEDGRLDFRVKVEYPGMRRFYNRVQQDALAGRPAIMELPMRQALAEMLVRFSLEQYRGLPTPKRYAKAVSVLAKIQRRLRNVEATVEDTAEATLRAYDILSRIPNEREEEEEWENQDYDSEEEFSEDELAEVLKEMGPPSEAEGSDEQEPYESPEDVDFRGDFKPELVQTLNRMRSGDMPQDAEGSGDLTQDMLEQMLRESAEYGDEQGEGEEAMAEFAQNLMKEAGATSPMPTAGQGYGPMVHVDEQGGELEAREPKTYVYDEWDFRAADYKPKWCVVREKTVDQGDLQFFGDTMRNYAGLVSDVRRQFELVIPESFRKVRRQPDGDEFDLDASIEAMIDRRSGITPSEKVYWFRNKQERDVAVVFLLDMSASTAEAIDEGRPSLGDQNAPEDPVEYMMWLRSRREGLVRRHYKRIIDLEKEGVALLLQALESIGDIYGIYGFSGYGRENVEFYVIKDVEEHLSDVVKRRIDKISPLHATRMGPAIRHATAKLEKQDAKTKILFLISDGRPQDRGYSREGVEKEYAVHDTHMALVEAKRLDITPFCLTVDKSGHDYLKAMCGDMSYEVLEDIWTLPQRLPQLYRKLTI